MNSSSNSWTVNNSGQHILSREAVAGYFFLRVSKSNLKLMLSSSCQQLPVYLWNFTNKSYLCKSNRLTFYTLVLELGNLRALCKHHLRRLLDLPIL